MEDPKVRVEWRETPEQAQAALAVAGRWLARRHAVLAGAFALVALLALALPDWCARLAIALPFAWLSYAFGAAYRRRAPRVDSRAVRAWIESARGKHTEGFREPASEIDSGELAHVEVDREGVEVGRGAARTRLRWAAVRRFRVHRDGHVLFLGRAAPGLFVPAWAFGGDAERAMLLDHARALCAASAPAETSPPLPRSDDGFEVSAIASLTLARLQRGPSTFGSYVWWPLLGYVVGLGVTSALPLALQSVEVAALFAALPHLAAIASLLMTPWGLTLLAARSARRHRVHRVRDERLGGGLPRLVGRGQRSRRRSDGRAAPRRSSRADALARASADHRSGAVGAVRAAPAERVRPPRRARSDAALTRMVIRAVRAVVEGGRARCPGGQGVLGTVDVTRNETHGVRDTVDVTTNEMHGVSNTVHASRARCTVFTIPWIRSRARYTVFGLPSIRIETSTRALTIPLVRRRPLMTVSGIPSVRLETKRECPGYHRCALLQERRCSRYPTCASRRKGRRPGYLCRAEVSFGGVVATVDAAGAVRSARARCGDPIDDARSRTSRLAR